MNLILHQKGTGEIKRGNTLVDPAFTDSFGELKKFDFVVMNPPFSDKAWSDGIKASEDRYKRFDGFGIPPEKNGDYAWFLHVLKSLNANGKAGIVMPHGVLFRGNAEEGIRKAILKRRYIEGIVSLPPNLFYGTGIPACIVILDKEDADTRDGIFLIDASQGFMKNGPKNQLREQDIEKIVQTFTNKETIDGYSRYVTYEEILDENDGNLNVSRYIQRVDDTLPQNIEAHLKGGIPSKDVESLSKLWDISPELKTELFSKDEASDTYYLALSSDEIENVVSNDEAILNEKEKETTTLFAKWRDSVRDILLNINLETNPKELIRKISLMILKDFGPAKLLDNYDVYNCLLDYWNEKLQDDVYAIKASGYEVAREIENVYAKKKTKDENGETVSVDDTSKVKSFDGALIPREVIESVYFTDELNEITSILERSTSLEEDLDTMREDDADLLQEVLSEAGDSVPKANLTKRLKELDARKNSAVMDSMVWLVTLFDEGKTEEMESLIKAVPELAEFELRNKNGKFGKAKLNAALRKAASTATVPESYRDEYDVLTAYAEKLQEKERVGKALKKVKKDLDDKVKAKYESLTVDEIKHLLFDKTWMAKLEADISDEVEQVQNGLSSRVLLIAKRYEHTLRELENRVENSKKTAIAALERMGYQW